MPCIATPALTKLQNSPQPHLIQTRPFFSWLLNPKEDPVVPKKLTPLKLEDAGNRLLFWDSTYTTPHLKPEFNGKYHIILIQECEVEA
jgi:hypothetical protein